MNRTTKALCLTAKNIAYIAVMTALLIGGQLALGFAAGIEVVTVLLCCFSCCFGVVCGMLTAVAFSLLRCFIWGFYPSVIILYLIYYPVFALVFGLLGKIKDGAFDKPYIRLIVAVNVIFLAVAAAALCAAAFSLIKISRLYIATITVCLYVVAGLCLSLAATFDILCVLIRKGVFKSGSILKIFLMTAVAALLTICFTLLDDVISPLIVGMTPLSALSYFYASFAAMLPQTICAIVTVSLLYFPLCAIMKSAKRRT